MKKILTYRRILLSLCLGFLVCGLVFKNTQRIWSSDSATYGRMQTRSDIQFLDNEVRAYRKKHGKLPRSLKQLGDLSANGYHREANGEVLDVWLHPYIYEVQNDNFRVVSYGADGQPGGFGADCDLASDDLYPRAALIPVSVLLTYPDGPLVLTIAFGTGLSVAVMSWLIFGSFSYWFFRLCATLCLALFATVIAIMLCTAPH